MRDAWCRSCLLHTHFRSSGWVGESCGIYAVEQGTQELFEGLASDIGIRSQIVNKEIGEDSAANLILGALGGVAGSPNEFKVA